MSKKISLVLAFQLIFAWGALIGQNITSSVTGFVTDPQGAMIPGAKVIVKNQDTGIATVVTSNDEGSYLVPGLLPGNYSITVSMAGFETSQMTDVHLFSSATRRADIKLGIGALQQTVTVTDEKPQITTDSMTIASSITSMQLSRLPSSMQSVDSFVSVAAGVNASGDMTNPKIGGGGHWGSVSYTVNGVGANDQGNSGAATVQGVGTLVLPPPSSMEEVNVMTSNVTAKFAGHATVSLVTKGGTNRFHGLLYEFLQNTVLNANTFTANSNGLPRLPTHVNQFGGNIGGPILRNKAFFFFDFGGVRRSNSNVTTQVDLPGMAMRAGDFSAIGGPQLYNPYTGQPFQGNVIPASMIAPQAKALLKYLPEPDPSSANAVGKPTGLNNFVQQLFVRQNADAYSGRVDYNISSSDRIFGVYAQRNADPWDSANNAYPSSYGQGRYSYKNNTMSGTWTHTFNQSLLNELRVSRNVYTTTFSGQNQDLNPQTLFPAMPATMYRGLTHMTITGYGGMFHDYGTGYATPRFNVEFNDNITYTRKQHTIEAGLYESGSKINSRSPAVTNPTGSFTFNGGWTGNTGWPGLPHTAGNGFADFLLGAASASSTPGVGKFAANIYSRYWGIYAQDTWQTTPRLTIVYGVRYEYQSPWKYSTQNVTTWDQKNNKLVLPQNSMTPTLPADGNAALFNAYPFETTQSIGLPLDYIQPDRNNVAPRVGFAFRPFANGRTVLRAGYGVYYNFQPAFVGSRGDAYNPPWQLSYTQSFTSKKPGSPTTPFLPDITFDNPYPSVNQGSIVAANPDIGMLQWDFKNAYMHEWSLSVEQGFSKNWSMRLTYLGHLGRSLPYNGSPINVPDVQIPNMTAQLQRPYQPWGGINVTKSTGSDNFNSAQIEVNKRFSHGVSFQAQYSYNRGLDNVAYAGGPQRPLHPELDYGNSTGQPRQWLVFNYVYELPFGKGRQFLNSSGKFVNQVLGGWQLAGISTYGGGVPNSVTFAVPASVTGWWGGRADRVSGVSLYEGRKKSHDIKNGVPWFNTNAFAPPAKWQWGNSARDLLFAPGMWNWDMSGSKTFGTPWERMHVEFRGDFFDAFNHFNLGAPTYAIADTRDGGAANANSGKITGGSGQRSIQLNLNLKF